MVTESQFRLSRSIRAERGQIVRVLIRGLVAACPACGGRGLFHRPSRKDWMRIRTMCPKCGLVFERTHGHWIGAVAVNMVMTFVVILVTITASFLLAWPDLEVPRLLVPTVVASLMAPLVCAPISRTLWTAMVVLVLPDEPPSLGRPVPPEIET